MEEKSDLAVKFDLADSDNTDDATALRLFREIFEDQNDSDDTWAVKSKSIVKLGELHGKAGDVNALSQLLKDIQQFFSKLPKAKTAKIVRALVTRVGSLPGAASKDASERLCRECIEWCYSEKRTYLRHRIQARLGAVLHQRKQYKESLAQLKSLTREIKKLDDKQLMVEISLTESRVYHELKDLPKAKAALTAARSNANSMYVPPRMQGEIDQQAGILHAEEHDYKTAYSYFFEAFEAFHNFNDKNGDKTSKALLEARAVVCLKYMLLCKIMLDKVSEVTSILASKHMQSYSKSGPGKIEVEAMQAVGAAYKEKSLKHLEKVISDFSEQLSGDVMVKSHLNLLHEKMLEQNLHRIIKPYSRVEIAHVATQIDLPLKNVEDKLSQMILDGKFEGILDQGRGHLIIFDEQKKDRVFDASIGVVKNMGGVLESLFKRTKLLHA